MVGTPMEMVTVYHMDGHKLVATHYCMLGNQPYLTAASKMKNGTLTMTCTGKVSNAASHDDEHMHRTTMRLAKNGKLHIRGEAYKDGEVIEHPAFVLTRKAPKGHRH